MSPKRKLEQRKFDNAARAKGIVPWGHREGEVVRREFFGERDGGLIVCWLNGEPLEKGLGRSSKPSRQRIEDLITNIRELASAASSIPIEQRHLLTRAQRKVESLEAELEAQLSKYPTIPFPHFDSDNRLFLELGEVVGRVPTGESVAAHSIVRLYGHGLLDRVRQCICGRWFFARFRNQTSCSSKCRHSAYEKTDQFRAKRREYMRRYYQLKHSGKVK